MNGAREFGNQFRCTPDRHRLAFRELVERAALDQFHAEEARPIRLAHFVNGNDIGVIQARRSLRFQPESFKVRLRRPLARPDNL